MECKEILSRAGIEILWFDSMGAKCFSIAISSSKGIIVIDPGSAEMQPSYPLPQEDKLRLRRECVKVLEKWTSKATTIIVTHYHYDHHILPSDKDIKNPRAYWLNAKTLLIKNPNIYINESQWGRARLFISELLSQFNLKLEDYMEKPKPISIEDPVEKLEIALSRDYGDYNKRRGEILAKGREWFKKLIDGLWLKEPWIKELTLPDETKILWGDGRELELGEVKIKIFEPWFHGMEYDRTGWITPIFIESRGYRAFYSSDLMGPIIEDYAEWISKLKPDIVFLDGPPTYLFPYMFNRINLQRAIDNAITIIKSRPKLLIYDHHLLRERRWRERVSMVFEEARSLDVQLLTGAECLGDRPLIDKL